MEPRGYVPKLEWVDPSDAQSRKRAQVHADLESRRKRQWMQREQLRRARISALETFRLTHLSSRYSSESPSSSDSNRTIEEVEQRSPAQNPSPTVIRDETESIAENDGNEQDGNPRLNFEASGDGEETDVESIAPTENGDTYALTSRHQQFPDPLTWLASLRRDPFGVLPSNLDSESQSLIHHYMIVSPLLLFNVQEFMPYKEFTWSLALTGPLALHATILTFSAAHLARLRGLKNTVQSVQRNQTVVKMLQSRIGGDQIDLIQNDETITGILAAATTENQFGSSDMSLVHMRVAMHLIRRRGGPTALDQNRKLASYVNWVDFSLPVPQGIQDLWRLSSLPLPVEDEESVSDRHRHHHANVIKADIQDFTSFLQNARMLSFLHARSNPADMPFRHSLFQPGSILYELLLSPIDFGGWDHKRITHNTRLAILIYIHAALLDYRLSPPSVERFLAYLDAEIQAQEIPRNVSIVLLIWILLKMDHDDVLLPPSGNGGVALPPSDLERRPWYTARMLRVAKLLRPESWERVNEALLRFLDISTITENVPVAGRNDDDDTWIGNLETEIFETRAF